MPSDQLHFVVRTEIWNSWWHGTLYQLKALPEHYHYSRIIGSALWASPCPIGNTTGHGFRHISHCHSCHSLAKAEVKVGQPAGPSSARSPNLETLLSNIPYSRKWKMKVCPITSINHFRYHDRYQSQLFSGKAAGERGREGWQGYSLWVRDQQEGRLRETELKL